MNRINLVAIDLAKNVFQIHARIDGKIIKTKLNRAKFIIFLSNLPISTVAIEACGTSHHWGRYIQKLGHNVKLLPPQYVKAFLIGNKNDSNDAAAIWSAAQREEISAVPIKTCEQQAVQHLHRIRENQMRERTRIINEARAIFREFGILTEQSTYKFKHQLIAALEDADNALLDISRWTLQQLLVALRQKEDLICNIENQLSNFAKKNEYCQMLLEIPGVGLITSTAIVSCNGNFSSFKKGRNFSAWLGLVPKHFGTGGKNQNLGIRKHGDSYIRNLLIHGARTVLSLAKKKQDATGRTLYLQELEKRIGFNKCCIALANKNARIIWAILVNKTRYVADYKLAV